MWLFQLKTHTVLPQFLFDWHWSHTYISHRLSCALLCFFINSSSPVWIKTTELRVLPCALAPRTQVVSSRTQQDTHTCPTCSVRPAVVMVRSGTVELPVRFPRLHAGNMLLRGHTLPGRVLFAVWSCASDCSSLVMRLSDWRRTERLRQRAPGVHQIGTR